MSLTGLAAVFFFAVLSALLWSYGLEMFTKCVKLILVGIFRVIKLIIFGRKTKTEEKKLVDAEEVKEKTS